MREVTPQEALAMVQAGHEVLVAIERRVYLRIPKEPSSYEVVWSDIP